MKSAPSFAENKTCDGVFKASLFKSLFKDRRGVMEGYPAEGKGLALPELKNSMGNANYTFKTTDTVDKISANFGDKEVQARYKKDKGLFDISMRQKMCSGPAFGLIKYEERQTGAPSYVIGADGAFCKSIPIGGSWNAKFSPMTGQVKASMSADLSDVYKGLQLAADCKVKNAYKFDAAGTSVNVGVSVPSQLGTTIIAANKDQTVTAHHVVKISDITAAVEMSQSIANTKQAPKITAAAKYKINSEYDLKVRVNQALQVQACVTKSFSPSVSVQAGTTIDLNKIDQVAKNVPAFGFKVVAK